MDENKRSFGFLKFFLILSSIFLSLFLMYSLYVYTTLAKITDPRKCFVTSMYKVSLCSSNKDYIRFKQLPSHLIRSLILSEDASFYSHKGLDWFEIKESFRRNFKEWKFARGGSTITQQLAKNLYLSKEKSINRKIKEFFLSKEIEKLLSKSQILEKYFNVVEFGPKIFGVGKASRYYFNKSVESLNVLESTYLISLLPNPKSYGRSFQKKELSKINLSRMKVILGRLYRTKRISDEVYIFSKEFLTNYPWPFPHYSNPFNEDFYDSIQEELMREMEQSSPEAKIPKDFEQEVINAIKESESQETEDSDPEDEDSAPDSSTPE